MKRMCGSGIYKAYFILSLQQFRRNIGIAVVKEDCVFLLKPFAICHGQCCFTLFSMHACMHVKMLRLNPNGHSR